jgi:hypothetical protein
VTLLVMNTLLIYIYIYSNKIIIRNSHSRQTIRYKKYNGVGDATLQKK